MDDPSKERSAEQPACSAAQGIHGDQNTAARDIIGSAITNNRFQMDVRGDEATRAALQQVAPPTLFTLPPAPPNFTGRAEERATLERLADEHRAGQRGALISGLRGFGGVGKTALALFVAHRLTERYPDAALYLDLGGASDTPMTVQEAQAALIRAFLPLAQVPDDPQALTGMFRSTLHGKRGVLLLDDAHDEDQVGPLLPPSTWAVLMTSRQRFPLDGLEPIELDRLNPVEAPALLQKLASRLTDVEADEIAALCGGLPLALQLAGGALQSQRGLLPHAYIRQLSDEAKRFDVLDPKRSIEAALTVSLGFLTDEQQRRWAELSVFPSTFDALGAAAVWGEQPLSDVPLESENQVASDDARRCLGEMERFSLVDADAAGRYQMHDLARLAGTSKIDAQAQATVARRHAHFYMHILAFSEALYRLGNETIQSGLAFAHLEWQNIVVGHHWAASHAAVDDDAAQLASQYTGADSILSLRLRARERIIWLMPALEWARRMNFQSDEGAILRTLGFAHAERGETLQAIDCYKQALEIFKEIDDQLGQGRTLGNLGSAYLEMDQLPLAFNLVNQQLSIARKQGDRGSEASALGALGNIHLELKEISQAIDCYEQSLVIAREIGDRQFEGVSIGNIGLSYYHKGDFTRAIEHYHSQFEIAHEIGDLPGIGDAFLRLGVGYASVGEQWRTIGLCQHASDIFREIGDRDREAGSLLNVAVAQAHLGDIKAAIENAELALVILEGISTPTSEMVQAWLARQRQPKRWWQFWRR